MPPGATTNIIYRPCPTCNALMMRRNFGRVSGIIVDECRRHGSYFDIGELEDVLAFVRSGGLQAAQRHADEEHSRVMRQRVKVAALETSGYAGLGELPADDLGNAFSRLIARWLSRRF
jgi:Zn-finger nucleic acid-binding protein